MRNLELPGRSVVHGVHGMASTSHTLSTQAAIETLQKGGNALDAAIAAVAVQCVVEPQSTGIGGDCFCMYAPNGSVRDMVAYNGSGRAPGAATLEKFQELGVEKIERQSPHSVTVPGAVDAWEVLLRDHGRLSLAENLNAAIGYARNGYPVSSRVSVDFAGELDVLQKDKNAAAVFLRGGRTLQMGERHVQPNLANTLEKIADNGRAGFYEGDVADDIVSYLQSLGGLHTLDDFKHMRGEYVVPISSDYRGYDIYQCPPNGQGVIALLLLNIMKGFDVDGVDPISVQRLHQEIEAGRLAYQDRNAYVADPAKADVPVDWLLSDDHAAELRAAIVPERAMDPLPPVSTPKHNSTVYITVVDKHRNACSFINTIFESHGSGQMAPKSGVMLHNRAQGFVLEDGHPNCIAPFKRPMHTIIPAMAADGDKVVMPFGVMGGQYQAFGHMQFLSRLLDFGCDIQEAQDLPRVFPEPGSMNVQVEGTIPADVIEGLRALGHKPYQPAKPIGGSQAIWIDWENGLLMGGSDPRKDGAAMGY